MLQESNTQDKVVNSPARSRQVLLGALVTTLILILLVVVVYIRSRPAKPAMVLQSHDDDDDVSVVAWSPDGTRLASGPGFNAVGPLSIWDVTTGQRVHVLDKVFGWDIAWSPDSTLLAVAEFNDVPLIIND